MILHCSPLTSGLLQVVQEKDCFEKKIYLEVFARTIGGISTKSESESVSVENSAKSDIGPFCANNWGILRRNGSGSSTLDC